MGNLPFENMRKHTSKGTIFNRSIAHVSSTKRCINMDPLLGLIKSTSYLFTKNTGSNYHSTALMLDHFGTGFTNASTRTTRIIYSAIKVFSPLQIQFLLNPKQSPDELVTEMITKSIIMIIFGILTSRCLLKVHAQVCLGLICRNFRRFLSTRLSKYL